MSYPAPSAFCPVAAVGARQAIRWALPAGSDALRSVRAAIGELFADAPAVRFRRAATRAPDEPAVPLRAAEQGTLDGFAVRPPAAVPIADAPAVLPRAVAAWEASDAAAVLPRAVLAAGAVSDVAAALPLAAAARHEGAAAAGAGPRAAAEPTAAVRAAARRREEALRDAAAVPAALPSAVAWVFRQDRLRPAAAPRSKEQLAKEQLAKVRLETARPLTETRPVPAMRCLPIASRSARLSQAAQDGICS